MRYTEESSVVKDIIAEIDKKYGITPEKRLNSISTSILFKEQVDEYGVKNPHIDLMVFNWSTDNSIAYSLIIMSENNVITTGIYSIESIDQLMNLVEVLIGMIWSTV